MSLLSKHDLTDKEVAARKRNGAKSRGAATPQGKERTRAAHLRHGFYAEGRDEALRALGEDPAELHALIASAHKDWRPTTDFQAGAVEHLARLLWRMQRAERIQFSLATEKVLTRQKYRRDLARHLLDKYEDASTTVQMMADWAPDARFYTPNSFFADFQKACGAAMDEGQKEILHLMHRLRKPEGWNPEDWEEEDTRQLEPSDPTADLEDEYLAVFAEMDQEDDSPVPYPDIPPAEGAERDQARRELVEKCKREAEELEKVWKERIAEYAAPLSAIEMDKLQAEPHPQAVLMRREEESCFRQFLRLGNFLMKFQNHAEKRAQNEGLTGEIVENTGSEETTPATECPPAAAPAPLSAPTMPVSIAAGPVPGAARPASAPTGPVAVAARPVEADVPPVPAPVPPRPVPRTPVPIATGPAANTGRELLPSAGPTQVPKVSAAPSSASPRREPIEHLEVTEVPKVSVAQTG